MRKTLNALLLGMILFFPAFSRQLTGGQEPAAPTQASQEAKAEAPSKGITPRASAARYAVHAELGGVAVGATLLTPDEVRQAFSTDLNRCCVVLEVGLYPEKEKTAEIAHQDFTFRVAGTDMAVKPSSSQLLALTLQLTTPAGRDVGLHGSAGVTYGLGGYDPVTGQPRGRGTGTSPTVTAGTGSPPPPYPSPDRSYPPPEQGTPDGSVSPPAPNDYDREFMELELTVKGLPEGKISAPVAGYLYFPLTKKMKKKKAARQLEYTLAGQKVALTLP